MEIRAETKPGKLAKENPLPFLQIRENHDIVMAIKKPDKMRMQVLRSSIPVASGLIIVQNGDKIQAYDSISRRTITSDLSKLFGDKPGNMNTFFTLLEMQYNWDLYKVKPQGSQRILGKDCWKFDLYPKRRLDLGVDWVVKKVVWIEKRRLIPIFQIAYGGRGAKPGQVGRPLLWYWFEGYYQAEPGVWAPHRLRVENRWGGQVNMQLTWAKGVGLAPGRVDLRAPRHAGKAVVYHSNVKMNIPMDDSVFAIDQ
jgi:hypothetical protein